MEGMATLEQTRWSEAPEMLEARATQQGPAPGGSLQSKMPMWSSSPGLEGASERELDVASSQEDLLGGMRGTRRPRASLPAAPLGGPAAAALLACLFALGAGAGLLAGRRPAPRGARGGVSLALGDLSSQEDGGRNASLSQRALVGQAFVHLSAEDAGMMVEDHMLVLEPGTALEDLHRIERIYAETGTLRLYSGLQFSHPAGATVASLPPTDDILAEHDATETAQFARFTRPVKSAEPAGSTVLAMEEGCGDFDMGDKVELSSEEGHYEMNMITSITASAADGDCEFHLAYPLHYEHSATSAVSKMVPKDALLLHTPAPTPVPTPVPPPTPKAPAASFVVSNVDFGGLGSPDIERLQSACREKIAAAAGVAAAEVAVVLAQGSVLVDVFIDSDKQADPEALRGAIQGSFESDAGLKACCVTGEITTASAAPEEPVAREGGSREAPSQGPSTAVVVSAIVIGFSVIGIVLFVLGNVGGDYVKANGGPESRWLQNPPDAIVVPGGGLSRDGTLVPWVQERLRRAKQIYDEVNAVKKKQGVTSTTYLVTMCEGIRYSSRDPRGNRSKGLESQLSRDFLRREGVTSSDIIADDLSLDTMGNAYFLRATHTEVFTARTLVVITNEFHMKRTKAIFKKVFGLAPFPEGNSKYTLEFEPVGNHSIEPAALQRRADWEEQQLQDFERAAVEWSTLHDVHSFIFSPRRGPDGASPQPQLRDRTPESR